MLCRMAFWTWILRINFQFVKSISIYILLSFSFQLLDGRWCSCREHPDHQWPSASTIERSSCCLHEEAFIPCHRFLSYRNVSGQVSDQRTAQKGLRRIPSVSNFDWISVLYALQLSGNWFDFISLQELWHWCGIRTHAKTWFVHTRWPRRRLDNSPVKLISLAVLQPIKFQSCSWKFIC